MSALPDVETMIRELIATPSVSSVDPALDQSNKAVTELLAGWLEPLGFKTELLPVPEEPHKVNLIATLGQHRDRGEGGLVLAGHTDTVPYDAELWHSDPFTLTERDGRLYGLGTADMKSFLACAMTAASRFQASDLGEPLMLLATADEESGMAGAKALIEAGRPRARYAVIGEPTNLRPIRMHKGIFMEALRLTGRSGHSSDPTFGNNALEGMHRAIATLLEARAELQQRHRHEGFRIPEPTLNLGYIHGGDNPNRICGQCELRYDLRPVPGMERNATREALRQRVTEALRDSGLQIDFEALFEGSDPFETAEDSPLVQALEALTGQSAGSVAFATEAPYLQQLGADVVVMGPGDIAQAHQPDEYVTKEALPETVEFLSGLIQRLCAASCVH